MSALSDRVKETATTLDATRHREAQWSGLARRMDQGLRRSDAKATRFWVVGALDFFDVYGSAAAAQAAANAHSDAADITTLASAASYTDAQVATRQIILPIRVVATTPVTAVAFEAIVSDSSGGARVVNLPGSPADGDLVRVKRSGGSTVTVSRNGKNIEGAAANYDLTVDLQAADFVYDVATTSWWIF